jgi:hypothetical protein
MLGLLKRGAIVSPPSHMVKLKSQLTSKHISLWYGNLNRHIM